MSTMGLRAAIKAAHRSTHETFYHGVAIEKGGALLAIGWNHGEIHAEVHAMMRIPPEKRRNLTIWSIRITSTGKLSMAKPCVNCEPFLRQFGVKKVMYSTTNEEILMMRL